MLANKTINRAKNALSLYGKAVSTLQEQMGVIDEAKAHAIHTLLYVNMYLPFYKEVESSIPFDELTLLIGSLKNFKPDMESFWDKAIIQELIFQLLMVSDLLAQRLNQKHLSQVIEVVEQIPEKYRVNLSIPSNSITAAYLSTAGYSGFEIKTRAFDKQAVLAKANSDYLLLSYATNLEKSFNITATISDEDLLIGLQALPLLYLYNSDFDLNPKIVPSLMKSLTEQYADKEKLVRIFLEAYQNVYKAESRKSPYKNTLLAGIAEFFPMLDTLLPSGKFSEILQNIMEGDVYLEDPIASEHDESYELYQACLFFYADMQHWERAEHRQVSERSIGHFHLILNNHKFLYPHLQVAGRNMLASVKQLSELPLSQLPLLLQTELVPLLNNNSVLKAAFISFVGKFSQINAMAETHQQRDLRLFFSKHQDAVMSIIKVMGIEGVRYLSSHLAGSVLHLERTLSQFPTFPETTLSHLAVYCQLHAISLSDRPDDAHAIVTSMIVLGMLTSVDDGQYSETSVDTIYLALSEGKSPKEYMLLLTQRLLEKMLKGIDITLAEEEITGILERVSTDKLVALIAASNNMSGNEYQEVYLNLLKLDLTHGDIDQFLHDVTQKNQVGQVLARHNQRIRHQLETAGINSATALAYDKKLSFIVAPEEVSSQNHQSELFQVLLGYIQPLKLEIEKIAISDAELSKLSGFIGQLQVSPAPKLSYFEQPGVKNLIGEINTSLNKLTKRKAELPTTFNEFSEHVREQYKKIKESRRLKAKENKSYHFTVEQWNKCHLDTFFLGDAVGCCLGTTSSQFQAMVQRRMDDAMLFHVAVDQSTGRPAALIWLYLAEATDKTVVLMANFFEVNVKYATSEKLRLALLDGLLQFTHQYCQDNPKIQSFYMNQLSYGWNSKDLDRYEIETVKLLDKVGGPFMPGIPEWEIEDFYSTLAQSTDMQIQVKEHTQQKYYLVSLSQEKFHKFDPAKLTTRFTAALNSGSSLSCSSGFYGAIPASTTNIENRTNSKQATKFAGESHDKVKQSGPNCN